jgi:hypothetical protein
MVAKKILCLGILFLVLSPSFQAEATETLFGHSFTTDTLPKNKWEVAQSYFGRFGKMHGSYVNQLYRTQIEYGITSFFQSSVYVNTQHLYASRNLFDRTTGGQDVPENSGLENRYNKFRFHSVSIENIYRLFSPYTNPVGGAVVFEPTMGPKDYALDQRFVLQKNFMEDRMVIPLNLRYKLNWNKKTGGSGRPDLSQNTERWDKKSEFEYTTGILYRFIRNWSAGAEFKGVHTAPSFKPGDIQNAAFFMGPTLHYGGRRFWATLSVLFQLPFAQGFNERQRNEIESGRLFGNEFEKAEVRAKAGCVF